MSLYEKELKLWLRVWIYCIYVCTLILRIVDKYNFLSPETEKINVAKDGEILQRVETYYFPIKKKAKKEYKFFFSPRNKFFIGTFSKV